MVADATEACDAVGCGGFGVDQCPEGAGEVGVPGEGVSIEEGEGGCCDIAEAFGTVAFEKSGAGIDGGGDGGGSKAAGGDGPAGGKSFAGGEGGGRALSGDDFGDVAIGVVDEDGDFAAEAEEVGVGDAEREDGGDGGIGGVAALLKDGHAGGDSLGTAGGNGTVLSRGGPADGVVLGSGEGASGFLGGAGGGEDEEKSVGEHGGWSRRLATLGDCARMRDRTGAGKGIGRAVVDLRVVELRWPLGEFLPRRAA